MYRFLIFSAMLFLLAACSEKKDKGLGEQSAERLPSFEEKASENDSLENADSIAFEKSFVLTSDDSLELSADLKHIDFEFPTILFFHNLESDKSEFDNISDTLYRLGFNCLTVDMRLPDSGKIEAKDRKNVEMDMKAAISYVSSRYEGDIILFGSGYSAALVLAKAKERDDIDKVIAFGPGPYIQDFQLLKTVSGLDIPTFITSPSDTDEGAGAIFSVLENDENVLFKPAEMGSEDASALWADSKNSQEYWSGLRRFLKL